MTDTGYKFAINEQEEKNENEKNDNPQSQNQKNSLSNKSIEISSLKNSSQLKDEPFKPIQKSNFITKILSNFSSGSLTSCVFNLCILSLGTGSLALPQKIGYMSLFFSPVIIILSGLVNYWSLNVLSNASKKYKINSYEGIVSKLFGKMISIFLGIIMCINQTGMIILYQVILYKLLGGVINEAFNLGYQGVEDFALNSFWHQFKFRFFICYIITAVILTPLCLLKNISKMRYASMFGIFSLFFLIFIVVIECPFYIRYNFFGKNKNIKLNYIDVLSGFKGDMKILQAISTLFYAFSCHVGVFPVLNSLKNPSNQRIKKLFKKSIALDIVCYLIIGISGYLTQPENTPDLIIERKKIFNNDFLMIIGQVCFIFTLIAKICANYNALRICIINLIRVNKTNNNQISNKFNFLLTTSCLIVTTFIAVIFQSISSYISLIGGFCSVIIAVLIPGLIYIKGFYELKINKKTIFAGIVVSVLTLMGFTNGILTIKKIVKEK